jgi:hypothetical protein
MEQGEMDAPVCTDCHGEHTITRVIERDSKVSLLNTPKTCSSCHEDERVAARYGLVTKRYTTYLASFHGVANKFGDTFVANCASCHGVHDILPESDPKSSINKANLPYTCGKCHPGASENFARGKIHVQATRENSPGVYFVRQFYIWFIGILMVCFVVYVLLDTFGKYRRRN